jgi:hypothetical protein
MDSLTLLERSYRKSRHTVDGEWEDKFRWCFGGDGGGGGGGGEGEAAGYDVGFSATDQAASAAAADAAAADASGCDASAMAANAAAANAAAEAASVAGFSEFGGAQTSEQAAAEQAGLASAAQDAFDMGVIDEAGLDKLGLSLNVEDPAFPTVEQRGPTMSLDDAKGLALSGLDLSPMDLASFLAQRTLDVAVPGLGFALNTAADQLGLNSLSTGLGKQAGALDYDAPTGLFSDLGYNTMTEADLAAEQAAQDDYTSQMARGGVVRLQSGIGSLYGKR